MIERVRILLWLQGLNGGRTNWHIHATMYLMGFVNSTFETRRPTGNLELVDLSLANKYHPPEPVERRRELRDLSNSSSPSKNSSSMILSCSNNSTGNATYATSTKLSENGNISSGGATVSLKPKVSIAKKPRRASLEDLPADLYMEPLSPLLLSSPEGVVQLRDKLPEETLSVNWLKEDLASRRQELDQEWSFCIGNGKKQSKQRRKATTTWRLETARWTSTFESVFADGGISIRVEHHPLGTTTEEDGDRDSSDFSDGSRTRDTIAGSSDREFCEKIGGDGDQEMKTDEGFARMVQHLESIERSSVKLPSMNGAILSQELAREDDAIRPDVAIQPGLQGLGVPIARSSKLAGGNAEAHGLRAKLPSASPSLSSPVMEKMAAVASPEFPYSWKPKKLPNRPKLHAVRSAERVEPVREERDLRYPTAKMSRSESQDELSFRLWEANDLKGDRSDESTEIVKIARKFSPPNLDALLNLRTFDLRSRRGGATTPKEDKYSEQDNPSPSSFTSELSPTSLFLSDDQEPFRLSVSSSDDNMFSAFQQFHKSPRSVLSHETPHDFTSDSSDAGKKQRRKQAPPLKSYFYNDESSDLESPMKVSNTNNTTVRPGFEHQPFPAFTYNVGKDMGATSSDEDDQNDVADLAGSLQELGFFREANHLEPWLVNAAGVLDDSEDLQFLLSPNCKDTTSIPRSHAKHEQEQEFQAEAISEDCQETTHDLRSRMPRWVPYVTSTLHGNNSPQGLRPQRNASIANLNSPEKAGRQTQCKKINPVDMAVENAQKKPNSVDTAARQLQTEKKTPVEDIAVPEKAFERTEKDPVDEALRQTNPVDIAVPEKAQRLTEKTSPVDMATEKTPVDIALPEKAQRQTEPTTPVDMPTEARSPVDMAEKAPQKLPRRSVNFAPDLVKEIPYSSTPNPDQKQQQPKPRANREASPEQLDDSPSIMSSRRRRWRKNQDGNDDSTTSPPGGSMRSSCSWRLRDEDSSNPKSGSTRSWSWSFAETRSSRRRVAPVAVPTSSCVGRLFSWPQRLPGFKSKSSKIRSKTIADSDDDYSFHGDQSFGVEARRDAELVRRILKGSQKKYSNLTVDDILKEDFG